MWGAVKRAIFPKDAVLISGGAILPDYIDVTLGESHCEASFFLGRIILTLAQNYCQNVQILCRKI